ncbi:MAG: hypothetical protein JXQ27_11900 [Acidobacteria bacterium]|nr:hypothetical protein [Acidobacteriota bacterium]
MRRIAIAGSLILLLLAAPAAAAPAKKVVKGDKKELRGVTRIYVQANDKEYRRIIETYIMEELRGMSIVSLMSEADAVLTFTYENPERKKSTQFKYKGHNPRKMRVEEYDYDNFIMQGRGEIFKVTGYAPDSQKVTLRLLAEWESGKINLAEVTDLQIAPLDFAREFVKLWRKYN